MTNPSRLLIIPTLLALVLLLPVAPLSAQENLDSIFKRVNELVAQKNYTKALEELGWANKEIEKLNSQHLQSFFPAEVEGYKGGKFESSNALGFTNLERTYTKGSQEIRLSLTGGQGAAGMPGLGGLAALGKMAAMMGNQPGTDTFRISGRTASLSGGEGEPNELTIFLDSGSVLRLEADSGVDTASVRKFAEGLQIESLDNYLRGQA